MKDNNIYKCWFKITLKSSKEAISTIYKWRLIISYIIWVSLIVFCFICIWLNANWPICLIPAFIWWILISKPGMTISKSWEISYERTNETAHGKVIEEIHEIDEDKISIHNLHTWWKFYFNRNQIIGFYESEHLYILKTKYQFIGIDKTSFEKWKCEDFKEFANNMIIKNKKK